VKSFIFVGIKDLWFALYDMFVGYYIGNLSF